MYNGENSTPRKGFGQSNTHECPYCEHKMKISKIPFMIVCSNCGEVYNGELLKEIIKN